MVNARADLSAFRFRGVDISHWNDVIDWPRVQAAQDQKAAATPGYKKTTFAYIKATEGAEVDPRFAQNWQGVAALGWSRGAFHFFSFCEPGGPQADAFIAAVRAAESGLPAGARSNVLEPALDLEGSAADGDRSCGGHRVAEKYFRAQFVAFVTKVHDAFHHWPTLYVESDELYKRVVRKTIAGYPGKIWAADHVDAAPALLEAPVPNLAMWQYDYCVEEPGFPTVVDVDARLN